MKHFNKKIEINGIKFDSLFEGQIYTNAPDLIREPMRLTYTKEYIPDFLLLTRTGKVILIECKGHFMQRDRTKMIQVKRDNPDIDIRFIFQNANRTIAKSSKTTYGKWCDKNKFKWCEGVHIPRNWRLE